MVIAIDILKWPGMNVAFLFSFFLATAMSLAVLPYAKRRPKDRKASWGECMLGSMYAFATMILAFGIVPDRWIAHCDAELGWGATRIVYGPFDLLKPTALGGAWNPITIPYQAVRDVVVVLLHVWFFGLVIFLWGKWQKRGDAPPAGIAIETSSYGRPLVKKV